MPSVRAVCARATTSMVPTVSCWSNMLNTRRGPYVRSHQAKTSETMKIYISTPTIGRKERTYEARWEAAKKRVKYLKELLENDFKGSDFVTTFDENCSDTPSHIAMGVNVTLVLGCDAIYLDHGWMNSIRCLLEYQTAKIYGLDIYEHDNM